MIDGYGCSINSYINITSSLEEFIRADNKTTNEELQTIIDKRAGLMVSQ
jgi:hypothetical protein